jgi:serine/threonine protein kinase
VTLLSTTKPARLDELPAALALEVDALCDDFERHWRQARRRGHSGPVIATFLARAAPSAREVLEQCLAELQSELLHGGLLPSIPGLCIEEEIGRGGMGVVYRARRLVDDCPVAVKLIPGAEHARWSLWMAELADLRHPNLVPLEAFGIHDGLHFVVMPFVDGGDLKERFAELALAPEGGRSALRRVAQLTARVAAAVEFLHCRGILHRDLKPSNILLSSATLEPLVCDFGLAGRLDKASAGANAVVGTPAYMAPEQMAGLPLSAAADVWSVGAMLYELLAGRAPFVGPDGRLDAMSKRNTDPPSPRCGNAAVDEHLERICRDCLANDPAARYASAAALAADLNGYYLSGSSPVLEGYP